MTVLEALAITGAGAVAGGVNTVVGSGSLITFPTLLAIGYSPVTANVSNSIGLVPGGVSGSIGYRAELRGQGRRTVILGVGTTIGAVIGGVLLLQLPSSVFDAVVPALILLAVALMAFRPAPKQHEQGNNMARRDTTDPDATGAYLGWAFAWPLNRRTLYNRASADLDGKPWDPSRKLLEWEEWSEEDVPFTDDGVAGTLGRKRTWWMERGAWAVYTG